jgi:(2Fe-2S) ferredoxin
MSHFDKHVFFCVNQRAAGEDCCANFGSQKMRDYVKDQVKAQGLDRDGNRIRINSAGCLGRCDDGPVLVVYPEAVWYTYVDQSDLDEIIDSHLKNGRVVERLKV